MTNGLVFFGTLLAYAFIKLFNAPKSVLGWALLAILEIPQYHLAWVCYSIIYWACDLPDEDNFVLIAITTLAYAALISASLLLPDTIYEKHRSVITKSTKLLIILPVVCNNLLYHPILGTFRYVCYLSVKHIRNNYKDVTIVYLLFSKSETLIPLMIWHGIMDIISQRTLHPAQLPVVMNDDNDDDIHQLARVIKDKKQSSA